MTDQSRIVDLCPQQDIAGLVARLHGPLAHLATNAAANALEQQAREIADGRSANDQFVKDFNALRAENDTFRAAQKACEDCDGPTMADVAELRAKLAVAEKDAARYRWVLKQGCITDHIFRLTHSDEHHVSNAIDDAMKLD